MKAKTITISVIMTFLAIVINAQNFEVPKNYVLNVAADYAKYEKDIIAYANWMENIPLNQDQQKRTEANVFFMKWLTGSPKVTINLNADVVVKCTDKNADLLMIFLACWTRYALENNYSKDQQKGYFEGFKSIINVYKKDTSIKKDKDLENMIELYDNGQLETWIKENIK